jgi:two-component system chemotaxis sensor kinase CheA
MECKDLAQLCHDWEEKLQNGFNTQLFLEGAAAIQHDVHTFIRRYNRILNLRGRAKKTVPVDRDQLLATLEKAYALKAPVPVVESIEKLRERPIEESLAWIDDLFLSTAEQLKKKVEPIVWDKSVPICPDDYSNLFRSLVHVVRNAADHGIETPDEREASGKPSHGSLFVSLTESRGNYQLCFRDDGAGIDPEQIRARARSIGIPEPKTDAEVYDLLFAPDFSRKHAVSDVSGRGVGLDVVRAEARKLGGDAKISSLKGQGTEVLITFPKLNHAITIKKVA